MSGLKVTLCKHFAGIDKLDHVDNLLEEHHWGRDTSDDPGPEAVNLVGTSHFQSAGAPGTGKQA